MQNPQKLNFFLDIDDTLISRGTSKISDEVISTIKKAKADGSRFFINTARPFWLVPESIFPPDVFDGICTGCGTYIHYHGKCIYKKFIDADTVKALISFMDGQKNGLYLILEGFEHNFYIGKPETDIFRGYIPISSAEEYEKLYNSSEIQKFCFAKTDEGPNHPVGLIEKFGSQFDIMIHPRYTEAAPHGYSKGEAIKIVEKELGIPHSSTVAIGDSANDISMFAYACTSVAMGNAPIEIQEKCDLVTESCENNGVASAIERLVYGK